MVNFFTSFIFIILGYVVGMIIEKKHYKTIRKEEENFLYLPAITLKRPYNKNEIKYSELVISNVVISIDVFKKFLFFLINFFGGNVTTYETLIDRGRREAIIRLKKQAENASEIVNLHIETSSVFKNSRTVGAIEIIAYGTAIYR